MKFKGEKMKKILVLLVLTLFFSACNDKSAVLDAQMQNVNMAEKLKNKSFEIIKLEINGIDFTPSSSQDELAKMRFDDSEYSGFAGCNSFFGSFSTNGNIIEFKGNGGATKMICPRSVMKFENVLLTNLRGNFTILSEDIFIVLQKSKHIKLYLK